MNENEILNEKDIQNDGEQTTENSALRSEITEQPTVADVTETEIPSDCPDPFNMYNVTDTSLLEKYNVRVYSKIEERINYITHAIGAVLSLIGMFFLIGKSNGQPFLIVGAILFSVSSFVTFFVSALYHSLTDIRRRGIWRSIDHATIGMMIAGCFIPIVLSLKFNLFNYLLLGVAVGLATYVALLCIADLKKFKMLTFILQFVIGSLGGVLYLFNYKNFPQATQLYCILGGVIAVIGGLSYLIKTKYIHCVFHVIIMIASALFYVAVYNIY